MYFELTTQQKKAIKEIYNQALNGDLIHFYEGEPGSGKTAIMLHAALLITNKLNKPVVIATNNNSLVMQLSKELKKFEILDKNKKYFLSLLGAQNYIAPQRMTFYLEDLENEVMEMEQQVESEEIDPYRKEKLVEEIKNQKRFIELSKRWLKNTLERYKKDPEWDGTYYKLEDFLLNQGLIFFDDDLQFKISFKYDMSVKRHQEEDLKSKGEIESLDTYIKEERIFYDHACRQAQVGKKNVIITNHHLVLLALALHRPSFIFGTSDKPQEIGFLILDEAHTIVDAMHLLLSSSFAPFYLRGRISSILRKKNLWKKVEQQRGIKTLKKNLGKLKQIIDTKANKYRNSDMAGETLSLNVLEDKKSFKFHKKWLEEINHVGKKVKKGLITLLELVNKDDAKIINAIDIELNELSNIIGSFNNKNTGTIFVSYSQKRGNPSYSIAMDSAFFKLKNSFWPTIKKRKLKTALMSGTFFVRKGEEKPLITVGIAKPSGGISDLEILCSKEMTRWYSIIPSNFKKREMMDVVIYEGIRPPNIRTVTDSNEKEKLKLDWLNALATKIDDIYTKRPYRTLILLGSFDDSEKLGKILTKKYSWPDSGKSRMLWYCSRNHSTNALLREFLKIENGVFIGMKKFWTGFDIPNLINQIVARLPWDCPNNIKWLVVKENFKRILGRQNGYFPLYRRAMLLDFKQGCGRLIRFKKPDVPVKPTLFILDDRIRDEQTNKFSVENMLKLAYGEILGG